MSPSANTVFGKDTSAPLGKPKKSENCSCRRTKKRPRDTTDGAGEDLKDRNCIFPRRGISSKCIVNNDVPICLADSAFASQQEPQEIMPLPLELPTSFALKMFNQSKYVQGYLRDGKITAAQGTSVTRIAEPAVNCSSFLHSAKRQAIG